jgi:hypothetical protein
MDPKHEWLLSVYLAEAVELLEHTQVSDVITQDLGQRIDEFLKLYAETLKEGN